MLRALQADTCAGQAAELLWLVVASAEERAPTEALLALATTEAFHLREVQAVAAVAAYRRLQRLSLGAPADKLERFPLLRVVGHVQPVRPGAIIQTTGEEPAAREADLASPPGARGALVAPAASAPEAQAAGGPKAAWQQALAPEGAAVTARAGSLRRTDYDNQKSILGGSGAYHSGRRCSAFSLRAYGTRSGKCFCATSIRLLHFYNGEQYDGHGLAVRAFQHRLPVLYAKWSEQFRLLHRL